MGTVGIGKQSKDRVRRKEWNYGSPPEGDDSAHCGKKERSLTCWKSIILGTVYWTELYYRQLDPGVTENYENLLPFH